MNPKLLTTRHLAALSAALFVGNAPVVKATEASSGALGYTTITCKGGSDTLCSTAGITLKPQFVGKLNGAASGALITIPAAAGWTDDLFNDSHYVRFMNGGKAGYHYSITDMSVDGGAGTATLTLDLNGDTLLGTAADDQLKVVPHWTLATLLPLEDGVIHESLGTLLPFQKTQLYIPDFVTPGINRPANRIFIRINANGAGYQAGDGWKEILPQSEGGGTADGDGLVIEPDAFFFVRHRAGAADTNYTPMGVVETAPVVIALDSQASASQDNSVGLARPVPVKLSESDLVSSGFATSNGTLLPFRGDELYVYHNQPLKGPGGEITDESTVPVTGLNRPSVAIFYFDQSFNGGIGAWRNSLAANAVSDDELLMPGYGMVVRRKKSAGGVTVFWLNQPRY